MIPVRQPIRRHERQVADCLAQAAPD